MKCNEYNITKQLKRTLARIYLLSLVLKSEQPHRKALYKVLNEVYMPQDINEKTMKHLESRIQASNYLYFTEDELSPEGTKHNKPLCVGYSSFLYSMLLGRPWIHVAGILVIVKACGCTIH